MTYFGFKTLERSYLLLLKTNGKENILERPQYLMTVALGIHCVSATDDSEDERLEAAFGKRTISWWWLLYPSPTLFIPARPIHG
jgi:hypothetical protein